MYLEMKVEIKKQVGYVLFYIYIYKYANITTTNSNQPETNITSFEIVKI